MCDPVTEEQMADETSKRRPARSVGGPSAETSRKQTGRGIPGETII